MSCGERGAWMRSGVAWRVGCEAAWRGVWADGTVDAVERRLLCDSDRGVAFSHKEARSLKLLSRRRLCRRFLCLSVVPRRRESCAPRRCCTPCPPCLCMRRSTTRAAASEALRRRLGSAESPRQHRLSLACERAQRPGLLRTQSRRAVRRGDWWPVACLSS